MDKGRHPHVIRTWTVERTKTHYRPSQLKLRLDPHQTLPGGARHPKTHIPPAHGDGKPV